MTQSQTEQLDPLTSTLILSLDAELYSRDVLYGASYVFIDRAYVLLDREDSRYVVRLRGKHKLPEDAMRAMAGEFENELLAQALRERVAKANQGIIEGITALAISGATTAQLPAGDDPLAMDGFVEDPAGLGTPWEGKKGSVDG